MSGDNHSQPRGTPADCDACGATHEDPDALRCACGSLLARYVAGRIELKCRRCKRTVMLALDGAGGIRG